MKHTKFWISLMVMVMAFVGLMAGKISGGEFATISLGVSAIYGGANIGATLAHHRSRGITT